MATKKLQIIGGDFSKIVKELVVDPDFNPESNNAASGKAVNEAINSALENVYNKEEVDGKITEIKSNTYTKADIDDKISNSGEVKGGFVVSETEPENQNILWIDPANGLKYHNGTAWVVVPVAYS